VDADGVALAAIQALYQQNVQIRMQNEELKKEMAELRAAVEALRAGSL
jgi:cell division protein FtsB